MAEGMNELRRQARASGTVVAPLIDDATPQRRRMRFVTIDEDGEVIDDTSVERPPEAITAACTTPRHHVQE